MIVAVKYFVVALLLTGCATSPIQINAPNDTEFQKKLDHDPRFQKLMDQLAIPADDNWHVTASVARVQTPKKTGYSVEVLAKKAL